MTEQQIKQIIYQIFTAWKAARAQLTAAEQACARLEAAGMYPSLPSERWECKNGSDEAKYLYLYFRQIGRGKGYAGPEGKRKIYIGSDPERQAEARRLIENRRRFEELQIYLNTLRHFIRNEEQALDHRAHRLEQWLRLDLADLGPVGE